MMSGWCCGSGLYSSTGVFFPSFPFLREASHLPLICYAGGGADNCKPDPRSPYYISPLTFPNIFQLTPCDFEDKPLFKDRRRASSVQDLRFPPSTINQRARMSEVFESYERQYCEISASLSRKCTGAYALDGEQKKQKVSEIKSGIDDAESLIRKMDLEARSLQPSVKAALLAKIREYKSDLNNLKSEVKRLTSANGNLIAREELLESGMADTLKVSADQRDRLLMSTERLNHSSERINESRRTMFETEELGVSILQDLHQQRQSLLHANNTLHGVDDNIGKSRKVLTAMSRRMDRNKWIIGCVIVVLVLAILLILYFKLFH